MEQLFSIQSLVIEAPGGIALWDENTGIDTQIINNVIQNSNDGVVTTNKSKLKIISNVIRNNKSTGVQILHDSEPELINNEITNNLIGLVLVNNAKPTFGEVTGGGDNKIVKNIDCDLDHLGVLTINTIGTLWDDDVFNFVISNNCSGGENIVNSGSGSIDYQYIPPENILLFGGTQKVNLISPLFGELIQSNKPGFIWEASGTKTVM